MAKRARVWSVAELAAHVGISHMRARRMLRRLDARAKGKLLERTPGSNRKYSFAVAKLRKLAPELFEPVEDLEQRLEALEEELAEMKALVRRLAHQTGANTREIARGKQSYKHST